MPIRQEGAGTLVKSHSRFVLLNELLRFMSATRLEFPHYEVNQPVSHLFVFASDNG
jgi:hypothetical protein